MDINTHPTLKTNLVAYWTLDGNFNDSHTGGYNGTFYNSPNYLSAKQGTGVNLNGSSQYGMVADASGFTSIPHSRSFWFKADSLPVGTNAYLLFRAGPPANAVYIDSSGYLKAAFPDLVGPTLTSLSTISTGVWYHVMTVMEGPPGSCYLYINNVQQATVGVMAPAGTPSDNYFGSSSTPDQYFDGIIDEVGWWSKALSSGERTDLYQGGAGIPWSSSFTCISDHPTLPTGLLAHYKLDGDLTDAKGSYNLTQYGTMRYNWGKNGYAGYFGDQAGCGYNNATMQPSYVSIAGWVKAKVYPIPGAAEHFLAIKKGDPFVLKTGDNGSNFLAIVNTSGGNKSLTTSWGDTNWHFVAMTYDGSNLKIYKDADAPVSTAHSGTLNTSTDNFILGAYTTTAGWGSACWQDGFSVWNRALTAQEVADLYNSGSGLPYDTNPLSSTIYASYQSGDWSTPATWGRSSGYPTAGSLVTINPTHVVQIDGDHTCGTAPNDTTPVMYIDNSTLKWKIAAGTDRTFKCRGSIKVENGGTLQVGSEAEPIPATQKATFLFEKSGSTATVWQLQLANLTDTDKTDYGTLSIYGAANYHMASASSQRTTLASGVASGSDKTIIFSDPVDYQVGDTIWIGYGGDPTIDPFNGTSINALYGSDTVLIKTKIDAYTYTVDLTYTHVVGDFVIHKSRNVIFGCQTADDMKIRPYLYWPAASGVAMQDPWSGSITAQWAYLNKFECLYRVQGPFGFSDSKIPVYKNCIGHAFTYMLSIYSPWPWFDEVTPHIDEMHFFALADSFCENARGCGAGTIHLGHISTVDNALAANDGNYHGIFNDYNIEYRGNQNIEIDSWWVSWGRSMNFGYGCSTVRWRLGLRIWSMRGRVLPRGFYIAQGSGTGYVEGVDFVLNDMQLQHVYGVVFSTMSNSTSPCLTLTKCKFANTKNTVFSGIPTTIECYDCDFDGMASNLAYAGADGSVVWFTINWKFLNCTFGMSSPNAYSMLSFENIWFRVSGRILFENCQLKKPTNVYSSGTWTGIKGYFINWATSYPYGDYVPSDATNREYMPSNMTYEWVNCLAYDDSGVEQFAIEYPSVSAVSIVGGGGELRSEATTIIDGTFGVKMLPYAVHGANPGNKAQPIKIPLFEGEAVTLKMSLRKNVSLPTGKRPTFNARGCGLDLSSEMTDVNDTWEEQTLTGTALYEDTLEVWVTGGWNLYAGTGDDFWTPTALGTIVSYADKFSCAKTEADSPKVVSAKSLSLDRVRITFNRDMRVDDALLAGVGIANHPTLPTNLIAHYKLNGDLLDSTANHLDGTAVNGPLVYDTGKIGTAPLLSGTQAIDLGTNTAFKVTQVSFACWFRVDRYPQYFGDQYLISKRRGSTGGSALAYGANLFSFSGPYLRATVMSNNNYWVTYPVSLGWHFMALTYDKTVQKLYLDGQMVQENGSVTGDITYSGSDLPLILGGEYGSGTPYTTRLGGMLNGVMVASRAWTADEVAFLYNNWRGQPWSETTKYSVSGGMTPISVAAAGHKMVDVKLASNMTAGSSYTAGVIASSGIVDAHGFAFDDANRTASFTCYNSISTHPTLSDGSLCGAWLLDGNANDSSGNAYHGTINGTPTFVTGKIGQGLDFAAGAGNSVYINPKFYDRKKLNSTMSFSVLCWAKFNSVTSTEQHLVGKYATESKTNSENIHWAIYKTSSNYLACMTSGTSSLLGSTTVGTTWNHIAYCFDGRTLTAYLNGVLVYSGTTSYPKHKPTYPLIPIRIGGCSIDADPPYPASDVTYVPNAILDQVLYFNRALMPDEIKAIYNSGNGLAF